MMMMMIIILIISRIIILKITITDLIILVIKQIGLPLRGRPILLITRMITDRIGLHSVLLPLLITLDYNNYNDNHYMIMIIII